MKSPLAFASPVRFFHNGREYRIMDGALYEKTPQCVVLTNLDHSDPEMVRKAVRCGFKSNLNERSTIDRDFHSYKRRQA